MLIRIYGGKIQIVSGIEAGVLRSDVTDLHIPTHRLNACVSVSSLIDSLQRELIVGQKVANLVLLMLRSANLSFKSKAVWRVADIIDRTQPQTTIGRVDFTFCHHALRNF